MLTVIASMAEMAYVRLYTFNIEMILNDQLQFDVIPPDPRSRGRSPYIDITGRLPPVVNITGSPNLHHVPCRRH